MTQQKQNFDFYTQLLLLKETTVRFGVLHEAQVIQLKMYPILLNGVVKAETHVDTEKKLVFFKIKETKNFKLSKKNKTIMEKIVEWTRSILWSDCTVIFMKNEEVIYDTRS